MWSQAGSDADDDQEEDREEQTTGSLWGHVRLTHAGHGNNPPVSGQRLSKQNVVWEVVKHLKEKTAEGVVVDAKYTHVCVSPIGHPIDSGTPKEGWLINSYW